MENIFDILKAYNDLDTSVKKDNFILDGLSKKGKRWNEVSFKAVIDDMTTCNIYANPVSDKEEKLEQMIFIKYHKIALKKFPITEKGVIKEIREKKRFDIIKGIATLEDITPVVTLKLKELTR
jgi:hypothetical protein